MWTFLRVLSLAPALLLAAYAQCNAQALSSTQTPDQIKARGADWLKQCLQDWDTATHMTRIEWDRTCRRVVDDRVKWLFDQSKAIN